MKTPRILGAAVALSVALSPQAFAGVGEACKFSMNLGGGYIIGEKTTYNYDSADAAKISDIHDNTATYVKSTGTNPRHGKGYTVNLGGYYNISDSIALGVSFGYQPKNEYKNSGFKEELKSYNALVRAKYEFIGVNSDVLPFLELGAGIERLEYKSKDNTTRYASAIKLDGTTYSLVDSDGKIKKNNSGRLEVGAGVAYKIDSVKLIAQYTVGFSQSISQKKGQTTIVYDPATFSGNGTDTATAIRGMKRDANIQQIISLGVNYSF